MVAIARCVAALLIAAGLAARRLVRRHRLRRVASGCALRDGEGPGRARRAGPISRSGRCASSPPATSWATVRDKIVADEAAVRKFVRRRRAARGHASRSTGFEVTDALAQIYRTRPGGEPVRHGRDAGRALARRRRRGGTGAAGRRAGLGRGRAVERWRCGRRGRSTCSPASTRPSPRWWPRPRATPGPAPSSSRPIPAAGWAASAAPARACSRSWPATRRRGCMEPYQIAKRLRVVSTVEYFLAD